MTQSNHYRAFLVAAILIVLGAASLAFVPVVGGGGRSAYEVFAVGYLLGSIFGQSVLASAWMALGPGKLMLRAPLSILWCVLLAIAFAINVGLYFPSATEILIVMAICIAGIWALAQAPFWCLRYPGGLRVARAEDPLRTEDPPQYGIGQLLIFTTLVAALFGAGRAAISLLPQVQNLSTYREASIFVALSVAAVLISLPLVPALLLPRYGWLAAFAVIVLIALATWWELPLFNQVFKTAGGGPQFMHFVAINFATVLWIVLLVAVLRSGGYRLAPRNKV